MALDDINTYPPYEQSVLTFCRNWLKGQQKFVIHTSGSTGHPKAISLHRQQMIASAKLTGQALDLKPGYKSLVCLSVDYIAGMMMLVRGLELGLHSTIIYPNQNPLANFSPDIQFDFMAMVPLQLQATLAGSVQEKTHLNKMKAVLIGGAPINYGLAQAVKTLTVPLYHTYGMTETVSHVALKRLNGPEASERFKPQPGVELGLDERGCLHITAPMTLGQKLQTNDLVDLHADGSFTWLGRVDHVINSGGVKVQIENVEAALAEVLHQPHFSPYSQARFFVGSQPHPQLGQIVVAVLEGQAIPPETSQALKQALAPKTKQV
jgi:O-succinylbenzoic acid--CoA ligase